MLYPLFSFYFTCMPLTFCFPLFLVIWLLYIIHSNQIRNKVCYIVSDISNAKLLELKTFTRFEFSEIF